MGKILKSMVISASTIQEPELVFGAKPSVENLVFSTAMDQWDSSPFWEPNVSVISNLPVLCPVTIPEFAEKAMKDVRRWVTDSRYVSANSPLCAVVPLMGKQDYRLYRKTLSLTLSADEWEDHLLGKDIVPAKINNILGANARMLTSHSIVTNRKTSPDDRRTGWRIDYNVEISNAAGRSKTVYRLKIDGVIDTDKEYPTIPAARAEAKRIISHRDEVRAVEIVAEIQKENSPALITLKRRITAARASFDVMYAVTSENPTVTDYALSFWCVESKR